ncbi:YwpF family protein [Pontibacillus sp. HMF3514]|uniref:YwpF family protein n=1 Tax=Pontibacillus sp. HMF3514 TaxID=2692425 RepID=UPI0013205036|nr:YwpF family protein [Pontibacillus sp. HMF3514]QHE51964.1 hypothetical protein GS400_07940 [Pontibacillus sp. HMF3514]
MKTFKLIKLNVIHELEEGFEKKTIPLIDGLIINREDEHNQWLIEAYVGAQQLDYFKGLQEEGEEFVLEAKISKSSNQPAYFLVKLLTLNEIGEGFNVLFMGTIVDYKKEQVEQMLQNLIEEGYQGDELLEMFKQHVEDAETKV